MIFASDLDGTLIFSKRYLQGFGENVLTSLCLLEELQGKGISYTTGPVIEKLKYLNEEIFFIPVTTRTIHQYNRIHILREEIKPTYAIVSNGGNILKDGQPMEEWRDLMKERLKTNVLPPKDVYQKFNETVASRWVISSKNADDLFTYFILDQEKIEREALIPFFNWLRENHWTGSLQGRKLYLIPNSINKRDPLLYLMDRLGTDKLIAAGDSLLDLPMLRAANHAISPYHGEIKECYGDRIAYEDIHYTPGSGIVAAEEILDFVLEKIVFSSLKDKKEA